MKKNSNNADLPMGLGMALAKNIDAMNKFISMSADEQQQIINNTHNIGSKKEMQSYVNSLFNTETF